MDRELAGEWRVGWGGRERGVGPEGVTARWRLKGKARL